MRYHSIVAFFGEKVSSNAALHGATLHLLSADGPAMLHNKHSPAFGMRVVTIGVMLMTSGGEACTKQPTPYRHSRIVFGPTAMTWMFGSMIDRPLQCRMRLDWTGTFNMCPRQVDVNQHLKSLWVHSALASHSLTGGHAAGPWPMQP